MIQNFILWLNLQNSLCTIPNTNIIQDFVVIHDTMQRILHFIDIIHEPPHQVLRHCVWAIHYKFKTLYTQYASKHYLYNVDFYLLCAFTLCQAVYTSFWHIQGQCANIGDSLHYRLCQEHPPLPSIKHASEQLPLQLPTCHPHPAHPPRALLFWSHWPWSQDHFPTCLPLPHPMSLQLQTHLQSATRFHQNHCSLP